MRNKKHFTASMIKTAFRVAAICMLPVNIAATVVLGLLAEAVGVIEELVD